MRKITVMPRAALALSLSILLGGCDSAFAEKLVVSKENPSGEKTGKYVLLAISKPDATDGPRENSTFNVPAGIAISSIGEVYVADAGNNLIRKIGLDGMVSTYAGQRGLWGGMDGVASNSTFSSPYGLSIDAANNLYIVDSSNQTIRKIAANGMVSTVAGWVGHTGRANGIGTAAHFNDPHGIAVDGNGNVYVADTANNAIRKITPAGLVSTLAGKSEQGVSYFDDDGSADGVGHAARFHGPTGVAIDTKGNVFVADCGNSTIRKVTPEGKVSTFAGQSQQVGWIDGVGENARFDCPDGIAIDKGGNIYVADSNNKNIRKITSSGLVTTLAGRAHVYGNQDGSGGAARFVTPVAVAVDGEGDVYVVDITANNIRKITPDGIVSTYAGKRFILPVKK